MPWHRRTSQAQAPRANYSRRLHQIPQPFAGRVLANARRRPEPPHAGAYPSWIGPRKGRTRSGRFRRLGRATGRPSSSRRDCRVRHRVRAQGGDVAASPFTTPDRVLISRHPTDMRAGIQRLAFIVVADFGGDPQGGALYCFVSRDCEKMKMLRFDVNGWCLYYCRLAEGCFRWEHRPDYADPRLEFDRVRLLCCSTGSTQWPWNCPPRSPQATSSSRISAGVSLLLIYTIG